MRLTVRLYVCTCVWWMPRNTRTCHGQNDKNLIKQKMIVREQVYSCGDADDRPTTAISITTHTDAHVCIHKRGGYEIFIKYANEGENYFSYIIVIISALTSSLYMCVCVCCVPYWVFFRPKHLADGE